MAKQELNKQGVVAMPVSQVILLRAARKNQTAGTAGVQATGLDVSRAFRSS